MLEICYTEPFSYTHLDVYKRQEVASFSRCYLDDYPVKIWTRADGNLMVVGYQPGTLVKYYFSLEWPYMGVLLGGIAAVFIINLLLLSLIHI